MVHHLLNTPIFSYFCKHNIIYLIIQWNNQNIYNSIFSACFMFSYILWESFLQNWRFFISKKLTQFFWMCEKQKLLVCKTWQSKNSENNCSSNLLRTPYIHYGRKQLKQYDAEVNERKIQEAFLCSLVWLFPVMAIDFIQLFLYAQYFVCHGHIFEQGMN